MPKTPLALCLSFSLLAACAPPTPATEERDASWDEMACDAVLPPPPKVLARPPKCPTPAIPPAEKQAEPALQAPESHLDREVIRSVIQRAMSSVQACYERARAENPSLEGRIVVDFTINPDGRAIDVKPRKNDLGSVSLCVSHVVGRLKFPAPEGGGVVQISYPFVFLTEQQP